MAQPSDMDGWWYCYVPGDDISGRLFEAASESEAKERADVLGLKDASCWAEAASGWKFHKWSPERSPGERYVAVALFNDGHDEFVTED